MKRRPDQRNVLQLTRRRLLQSSALGLAATALAGVGFAPFAVTMKPSIDVHDRPVFLPRSSM